MELSEVERYAVASLFTLALHSTGFDGGNNTADAWGYAALLPAALLPACCLPAPCSVRAMNNTTVPPPCSFLLCCSEPQRVERDPRLLPYVSEAELDGWWGYDAVAPGGLLDRVFRELRVGGVGAGVAKAVGAGALGSWLGRASATSRTARPGQRTAGQRWASAAHPLPSLPCCHAALNALALPAPPPHLPQLPASKWKGLKLLPTAAPSAGAEEFRQMVRLVLLQSGAFLRWQQSVRPVLLLACVPVEPALAALWHPAACLQVRGLIAMLDPQLAAALPPLLPRRISSRQGMVGDSGASTTPAAAAGAAAAASPASPGSAERRAAAGSLFDGLCNSDSDDDSDEDWKADMERERKLQVGGWVLVLVKVG